MSGCTKRRSAIRIRGQVLRDAKVGAFETPPAPGQGHTIMENVTWDLSRIPHYQRQLIGLLFLPVWRKRRAKNSCSC